jgi:hypothetical protein
MVHGISSRVTFSHTLNTTSKKTTPQITAAAADTPAVPDWRSLFTGKTTIVTSDPSPANTAPTAESVFGPNPWISNPTGMGPGGNVYSYNPYYFATPQTAAKVAQMVGGTVVQTYAFTPNGGPFAQTQPNQMVQLPNGRLINPGLVASFYTHGYSQSYIDQLVAAEVGNS